MAPAYRSEHRVRGLGRSGGRPVHHSPAGGQVPHQPARLAQSPVARAAIALGVTTTAGQAVQPGRTRRPRVRVDDGLTGLADGRLARRNRPWHCNAMAMSYDAEAPGTHRDWTGPSRTDHPRAPKGLTPAATSTRPLSGAAVTSPAVQLAVGLTAVSSPSPAGPCFWSGPEGLQHLHHGRDHRRPVDHRLPYGQAALTPRAVTKRI